MKKEIFKGCGTALVTPFNENGVNFGELKKLIEFQIENNADALIICGTTGESSTMSIDEKKAVIKFAVDTANKRIPIIAGTGSNCTKSVIELTKYAEDIGADAVLIVTPYYNKTTQEGLIAHYSEISKNTELPIILYNVPSRTGVNILPNTCLELSKFQNIVAIKEASGNLSQVAEIASLCKDNLNIYSGNDDQILPVLSLGGIGVISVISNIYPKYIHDMIYNYFNGNTNISTLMQLNCINLIKALFSEINPIPVKEALNIIGFNCGIPRLPLIQISESAKENLKLAIKNFNSNI